MKLPFGVSQYTTWTQTFAQDMRLYRETGVEDIEVCECKLRTADQDRQIQDLLALGFNVSSVQPRLNSPFPTDPHQKRSRATSERMNRLRESVRLFGRHCPGTTLVVNTGFAPDGDFAAAYKIAEREFKNLAKYAGDHDIRIGLEPLNPIYMNIVTFICSLAQAGRLIDAVDHPQFGLFLDVWHFWEDTEAHTQIRKFAKKIFGVHVSDWRTPRAFSDRLLPGTGEIPLVDLLKVIRSTGYDGVYTLEVFSDLRLGDSLWANPRRTVIEGRQSFEKIWRRICAQP